MGDYKGKKRSSVWGTTSVKRNPWCWGLQASRDPRCGGLEAEREILGVGDYKRKERSSVWGNTSVKGYPRCGGTRTSVWGLQVLKTREQLCGVT